MPTSTARLGDILVEHASISRDTLEEHAPTARGRLGDYLRAHNHINGRDLARALAVQHGLMHVEFHQVAPDGSLFSPRDLPHYVAHRYVPFARTKQTLLIATPEPSEHLRDIVANYHGTQVRLITTSPRDLTSYFASLGATASSRHARLSLRRRHRHLVADRTIVPHQLYSLLAIGGAAVTALIAAPLTSWYVLLIGCNMFYFTTLATKYLLYVQGHEALREQRISAPMRHHAVRALRDADLPIYTLLIPLYRESAAVIKRLITNLNALEYPKEKLDIKLICEADDYPTIAALRGLQPPETMEIIRVAPSHPRTKPKACNVALQQIRGEYLAIFDAEDAPHPGQLKRAVAMFQMAGQNLACLQASLNYYNRDENLLTQLFSIEYSALFRIQLPALERLKLPIPLGGTSNHLRVAALQAAGGWDAFNVTEDADLGIRLAYLGYETRMLPSLTLEESPITLRAWMLQRTRWIKGYIQTWLVYTRDTRELKRRLGSMGYYGFQFFVGAPALTFLLAPIFWVVFLLSVVGVINHHMPPIIGWLCVASMAAGTISHWFFARAVLRIEGWHYMHRALLAYPLYWILHSFAAARAMHQLITAPHYWDKTKHGVSRWIRVKRELT